MTDMYVELQLSKLFGNAPRELKITIIIALNAINRGKLGEALNKLRQAEALIKNSENKLAGWRAEVDVAWALYYRCVGNSKDMWRKIARA